MVKDIQTAIESYRKLDAVGKRLFRAETGLESVKRRGAPRKAAKKKTAAEVPTAPKARKPKHSLVEVVPAPPAAPIEQVQ